MADESRNARAQALEEKRRKLEEMRARREQRGDTAAGASAGRAAASSNLDEYIDGLLSSPAAAGDAPPPVQDPVEIAAAVSLQAVPQTQDNVIAVSAAKATTPARLVETFEAGTQTAQEDFPEGEQEEEGVQGEIPIDEATEEKETEVVEEQEVSPKLLSAEEREEAVTSVPFSSFLNTASKKVERVLGAPVLADLLANFVGENDGAEIGAETQSDGSRFVSAREIFDCPKWTATRDVTDMDWSPLHRELMLSSYHMLSSSGSNLGSAALSAVSPDDSPSASMVPRSGELQSDGLVLVWSLAMPTRPEHIFACGSPVLKSRFHPTEAPLVIGGCQSGQIVIWDIRAGRLPVQRSGLGHAHPICGMEFVEGGVSLRPWV
jgi:dynein intermediate chain, cytosolic